MSPIKLNMNSIREFLLGNVFIINLLVTTISNYKPYAFYLKMVTSLTLIIFITIDIKSRSITLASIVKQAGFKKSGLICLALVVLSGLSLAYSLNLSFGIKKLLHLITSTIPAVLFFYYLLTTMTKERLLVLKYSTIVTIGFISLIVIIAVPFDFKQLGIIEIAKWSHVIYGRYALLALVVTFYLFFRSESKKEFVVYTILLQMNLLGIYFSGFRAGLLGSIIVASSFFLYLVVQKRFELRTFAIVIIAFIITFTLPSVFKPEQTQVHQRYLNLLSDDLSKDGPINSRFVSYEASLKKILERPILGEGFGGFANNNYGEVPVIIKYPHNMIVEFWVELGLPGLLLILLTTFLIFKSAISFSAPITIYFLASFWLAMFSKDIPSQTMFLIGIALIGYRTDKLFIKTPTTHKTA
jgi:O-antigen ligase